MKSPGGARRRSHFTLILTKRWLLPKNIISSQLGPLVCSYLQQRWGGVKWYVVASRIDSQTLSLYATRYLVLKHDMGNFTHAFTERDSLQCIISLGKKKQVLCEPLHTLWAIASCDRHSHSCWRLVGDKEVPSFLKCHHVELQDVQSMTIGPCSVTSAAGSLSWTNSGLWQGDSLRVNGWCLTPIKSHVWDVAFRSDWRQRPLLLLTTTNFVTQWCCLAPLLPTTMTAVA